MSVDDTLMCSFQILKGIDMAKGDFGKSGLRPKTPPNKWFW